MHFIFLGPGETGSWDAWLFWTQLALAFAAVSSPFIAHVLGNRRERRTAYAAGARQRRAERFADEQVAREKAAYSDSVFYAIHMEAGRIKDDLSRAKSVWYDSGFLPTQDIHHLQIDIPFAMGNAPLWLHLLDTEKLRATVDSANALASYNREIERMCGVAGESVGDNIKEHMQEKAERLQHAIDEILQWNARTPRKPFKRWAFI